MESFLILGILLLIQSLISLREGFRFLGYLRYSRSRSPQNYLPLVTLILPCKGIDAGFSANIASFIAQDYPCYQLIFALASEEDPAWERLLELRREHAGNPSGTAPHIALVAAGYSASRGEKVNKLMRGVEAASPKTEVLVFADADARPKPDWLRSLVAPLA